ncbi:MAG: amino acid racemase [Patescibacteria group bacterium]
MNIQNIKKKRIGILGGMGPESTVIFYQALVKQCQIQYNAKYDKDYPEIFIYNLPIPDVVEGLKKPKETLNILIKGVKKIDSIGVDFVVMPCNTAHYFYSSMSKSISVPFINIFSVVAEKIKLQELKKVGFLSTETTIRYKSFGDIFKKNSIKLIFPNQVDQNKLTQIILNILAGKKSKADKIQIKKIIKKMKQGGAEAIVLACTDLPILIKQGDVGIKIFDTVEILAEATIKYAIGRYKI